MIKISLSSCVLFCILFFKFTLIFLRDELARVDRYNSPSLSKFTLNMNKFTKYSNFKVFPRLILLYSYFHYCYCLFEVLGTLRYGDIFNQSSIVSSIEFDRDDEFFATAGILFSCWIIISWFEVNCACAIGVTKKIKIFDYNAIIRDTIDMHYPVSEMSCKSKIRYENCNVYPLYINSYLYFIFKLLELECVYKVTNS